MLSIFFVIGFFSSSLNLFYSGDILTKHIKRGKLTHLFASIFCFYSISQWNNSCEDVATLAEIVGINLLTIVFFCEKDTISLLIARTSCQSTMEYCTNLCSICSRTNRNDIDIDIYINLIINISTDLIDLNVRMLR